jgi:hypothetical protein
MGLFGNLVNLFVSDTTLHHDVKPHNKPPDHKPNPFLNKKHDLRPEPSSHFQVSIPDNQDKLWNIFVSVTAASVPWRNHKLIGITSISADVSIVGKYWQIKPMIKFVDKNNNLHTATIHAEYIVVPSKLSKIGIANHNEIVLPPSGSTKDWNIIVSIHELTNDAGINSILLMANENTRTYASWKILCFTGTSKENSTKGKARYLIVPKFQK